MIYGYQNKREYHLESEDFKKILCIYYKQLFKPKYNILNKRDQLLYTPTMKQIICVVL